MIHVSVQLDFIIKIKNVNHVQGYVGNVLVKHNALLAYRDPIWILYANNVITHAKHVKVLHLKIVQVVI